jgi:hypothetical protein
MNPVGIDTVPLDQAGGERLYESHVVRLVAGGDFTANARAAVTATCSSGQEPLPCKSTMVGTVAGSIPPGRITTYRRMEPSTRISNDSDMTPSVSILASLK